MDRRVTCLNALTALTPQCAKVPIHFDNDREAIEMALRSLALPETGSARVVRIRDTLSVGDLEISEALVEHAKNRPDLTLKSAVEDLTFDAHGNLPAIGTIA